ncbi:MAG: HAD family phosphatase [Ginsengibacter sp.]
MQNIKAIIFDLGGVLLNIDFLKVSEAFKALGVINFDELYNQSESNPLFADLETGRINEEEFCEGIKKCTDKPITNEDITKAWNAILLDFRKDSINYLAQLKSKYKLFLLSNTNIIHYKAFNKIFDATIGNQSFNSYFDKAYYSHEIGLRKPHVDAYQFVLNENNLQPQSAVFIDDTLNNIQGAKAAGLQTILLEKGGKIEDLEELKVEH